VLARGETVMRDGTPVDRRGHGRFLRCDRPEAARPRGVAVLPGGLV
jgi:dihydropyrimidinase